MKYAGKTRLFDYRAYMRNESEDKWAGPEQNHDCPDHSNTYDPTSVPLAIAIVPFQKWGPLFETEKGFRVGTIFPELDYPYEWESEGGMFHD